MLTAQLLDHESKASDQVPLLLTMKEDRLALVKAVDSGDSDLGIFSIHPLPNLQLIFQSISCSAALIQTLASGRILPLNRRRRSATVASE